MGDGPNSDTDKPNIMTTAPLPDAPAISSHSDALRVGTDPITIEEIVAVARGHRGVALDTSPAFLARITASREALEDRLGKDGAVYGVTTGVGASVTNEIPAALRDTMPQNLFRFHGCGTGAILEDEAAAAVVVIRLISLACGQSGVRLELIERLAAMVNLRLLPQIPSEGSVGASGDLTPLSYLAALVSGEREASLAGGVMPASEALQRCGLEPLQLAPKESLALMNGTSVMTALASIGHYRAMRLSRLCAAITAMACDVTHGNPEHFDARLLGAKPHPGQVRCGAWIRSDLTSKRNTKPARLQDRYSLRCAPHVIGALIDALEFSRNSLEIEINGVDDNPIISDDGAILHGGNFYGGHVAMACDLLKTAVANTADLLDRQLVLLCVPETSDGLPANLVASDEVVHHGFKAMQISASALTAEALKGTMPASAFSRSTESHNQDKVSMGTIAARDFLRVTELSETVAAIALLAVCQAVDLRGAENVGPRAKTLHTAVRNTIPSVTEDRRQDHDIEAVLTMHRGETLPIGSLSA